MTKLPASFYQLLLFFQQWWPNSPCIFVRVCINCFCFLNGDDQTLRVILSVYVSAASVFSTVMTKLSVFFASQSVSPASVFSMVMTKLRVYFCPSLYHLRLFSHSDDQTPRVFLSVSLSSASSQQWWPNSPCIFVPVFYHLLVFSQQWWPNSPCIFVPVFYHLLMFSQQWWPNSAGIFARVCSPNKNGWSKTALHFCFWCLPLSSANLCGGLNWSNL